MCSTASDELPLAQDVNIHIVTTTPNCGTTAPTLVFLHYWGGSSRTWRSVIRLLSNDYATVAIDLRGWGQSKGPDQKEGYTVSLMASDVEAVISYLHLADYIIIGLSMGAKIAQLVGAHQPQGLRALVLASPAPPSPLRLDSSMREQQIHAYDNQVSASAVTTNILTASGPTTACRKTFSIRYRQLPCQS
jgi:pimeloyl-ACP methyl ester carboxylesterase